MADGDIVKQGFLVKKVSNLTNQIICSYLSCS